MANSISLVNGRVSGWIGTTYIGRQMYGAWACSGSPLANPFRANSHTMSEHSRVVALYKDWLLERIVSKDKAVCLELQRLLDMYANSQEVVLSCWCCPLPCHGQVVIDIVTEAYVKGYDFV